MLPLLLRLKRLVRLGGFSGRVKVGRGDSLIRTARIAIATVRITTDCTHIVCARILALILVLALVLALILALVLALALLVALGVGQLLRGRGRRVERVQQTPVGGRVETRARVRVLVQRQNVAGDEKREKERE